MRIAMMGLRAIGQGSGGVEKAVEEIARRLAARGHAVTVFCRARYNSACAKEFEGVRLVNLPAVYTKHLEAITHTFLAACRALAGYDLVHIHATGPSMLAFLPRLAGRRTVVTVHGLDWKREKWGAGARLFLRLGAWTAGAFPHRTIVVSRELQRFYRERYGRETVPIPNGVTPGVRRPLDRLRRFGVRPDEYLLYLGRLVPEKGGHLLIEAFRAVPGDLKLLIVGGASHSEDYLARLRALAEGDPRIVFAGPLYGEEKEEAYSNARALVFPSTLEGMPLVLLEAMALGCPVLCSDIPENLEVVRPDGAPGSALAALFPAGSADALRAALPPFLSAPEAARARAAQAAAYVARTYDWDRITDATEEVYRSLAARV
ncbi:MAG TPA: glycosyltransferase family 4 protein [Kiritimatiellia bacterium]|nr:glycosyltransferase family 4 protein [Kiritimatiellia bacterium]HRZ12555.1 glycosyltransferase family 4 protein [Kiritimatiellia bacterium]HSA17633.1 glycosyltransferase family 4 protein [Kiritimatiellia bacterium]